MRLRKFFRRIRIRVPKLRKIGRIVAPAATIASFTPAGRLARIAAGAGKVVKTLAASRKAKIAAGVAGVAALAAGGGKMLFGKRKKRKSFKGISEKEMVELMKLQMFVGKYSMPYQIAVMKAIGGKLK